MGDGDHGWSAAEFVNLLRDMLVRDERSSILLASGVPSVWFESRDGISVTGASTVGGIVDYSVRPVGDELEVEWVVRRQSDQEPAPLYLALQFQPRRRLWGDRGSVRVRRPTAYSAVLQQGEPSG